MGPDWRTLAYPRYFFEGQRARLILWSFVNLLLVDICLRIMLCFASRYVVFSLSIFDQSLPDQFSKTSKYFHDYRLCRFRSCPINYPLCSDHGSMIRGRVFVKTVLCVHHVPIFMADCSIMFRYISMNTKEIPNTLQQFH